MAPLSLIWMLVPILSGGTGDNSCFPPEAGIDAFRSAWFCRQLNAAHEERLSGELAYRFSYIPSFHATRVVVAFKAVGRLVVIGKVLDGRGGYEPGGLAHTTRRLLSDVEWRLLEQRLENAGLWEPPDRDDRSLTDGAEWVLEGRKDGRHSFRAVHSPTDSTFPQYRKVCAYMLELADITPGAEDLY